MSRRVDGELPRQQARSCSAMIRSPSMVALALMATACSSDAMTPVAQVFVCQAIVSGAVTDTLPCRADYVQTVYFQGPNSLVISAFDSSSQADLELAVKFPGAPMTGTFAKNDASRLDVSAGLELEPANWSSFHTDSDWHVHVISDSSIVDANSDHHDIMHGTMDLVLVPDSRSTMSAVVRLTF